MTDLSTTTRAYMIGRCGDNPKMAEAVMRVLFQKESYRVVASQMRLPRRSLHRKVKDVRGGLDLLITGGHVTATDLIAAQEA